MSHFLAMIATFLFWVISLRKPSYWPVGFVTGLSYFYMVAAWGGYIFVLNMITLHAGFLLVVNQLRGVADRKGILNFVFFY
jgi:dolichyl-diphosphooligosaccharide--protein glycosyltransferase